MTETHTREHALERQFIELLLAELTLAPIAFRRIKPGQIRHSGLAAIYAAIIAEIAAAVDESPKLEGVIGFLAPRPDLVEAVGKLELVGRHILDRRQWLEKLLEKLPLTDAEATATYAMDDAAALALLKKLQQPKPKGFAEFMADLQPAMDEPLSLLPIALREAAFVAWACHKHLPGMETPMAITFPMSKWMKYLGEKKAMEVLEGLTSPGAMKHHTSTAEVICSMASHAKCQMERHCDII